MMATDDEKTVIPEIPTAPTSLPDAVYKDPRDKLVPHLPQKTAIPDRVFARGRRCENCVSYQNGEKAEQHFLARAGTTRPYVLARILIARANKKGEEIEMLRKQFALAPNAFDVRVALVHHENLLRRWATEIREAKEYLDTHDAPTSALNETDLRIYASIRRRAADRSPIERALYDGFGLASGETDEAGLCSLGAPGPDSAGSEFVASGYYCEKWSNPQVSFDQPDELPAAIEENIEEEVRKRSMGT